MHWLMKSAIQNSIAMLPGPVSQKVYYAMQRRFGGLRSISVEDKLRQGIEVASHASRNGLSVEGARVLEVGTGRRLNLPLSLWLQGAASVVTVDLNPYLRAELVYEDLRQIRDERPRVEVLFGERLDQDRLQRLLALADDFDLDRLLETCSIRYLSPGDAACLDLPGGSVDLHVSYEVFEHIPAPVLVDILKESSRLVSANGLILHYIDFSDHFSHSDPGIGPINFLKFGEGTFRLLAGNSYMYMNRLRLDDFREVYARAGHLLLSEASSPDADVARKLAQGEPSLDVAFAGKPRDILSTLNAWMASRPGTGTAA